MKNDRLAGTIFGFRVPIDEIDFVYEAVEDLWNDRHNLTTASVGWRESEGIQSKSNGNVRINYDSANGLFWVERI
jgi:hypothetical protein